MKKLWSSIQKDLKHCYVCGSTEVAIHHVFGGTYRRKISEVYGFIVALHPNYHTNSNESVHLSPNTGLDLELKQKCQTRFEESYGTREEFINHFGKSYL